ncbi:glycosyltransferase [Bradyrhizobium sp. IC3195]|uniref:glycosyltransferase n=1 Tax=Bradyrhizobium sp. IC3195 TaxID=2793804 RepID=UPI001CD6A3AE|nr:glycosyltransferase [Bradyrhizobium sp. IC3195]MCA1469234.1 glycosyltransferase [Bradyrhizobium sp. IC3195]
MSVPSVSIVMAAYNASRYLRESVDSILAQTFRDFEFVIIDDGSTDDSAAIIASYADQRVRLISHAHAGLVASLNRAVSEARAPLIARMDADDRALPNRLARQVAFLDNNPEIDILCTDVFIIAAEGKRVGQQVQLGVNNGLVRDGLLHRRRMKPIIHPSVMMRRQVIDSLGGYREFRYAEDHDFWLRAVDRFNFARLNEKLLEYRIHDSGLSRTKLADHMTSSVMSEVEYLVKCATGQSLFASSSCFEETASFVRDSLQARVLPGMIAFREFRQLIRKRQIIRAAKRIVGATLQQDYSILPWYADRQLSTLALIAARRSIATFGSTMPQKAL